MRTFELPVQVHRDQLAPPGIQGDLLVVATTEGEAAEPRLHATEERDFFVYGVFSRDMGFDRDLQATLAPHVGSSFFRSKHGTDGQFIIQAPTGDYRFVNNASGEFSSVTWSGRAKSPLEARTIFLSGILPALDHLAYLADTPLIIANVVAQDIKHNVFRSSYMAPYQDKNVGSGDAFLFTELAPIYALYRESKNSLSPFYRFLCLYKILEGVYGHLRSAAFAKARAMKLELVRRKELIPDHPELRKTSPGLIGKPIKPFVDQELQPRFRNAVAHFLTDGGAPLNPSDPQMTADFQNIMLVVELACRVVIEQHEDILDQIARAGG